MSDERTPQVPPEEGRSQDPWGAGEPALTPRGTPARPPVAARSGAEIHAFPETAVGEGDVRTSEEAAPARGTSLWRDAWKRLLKNRLAVFGMFVVGFIAVAVIVGPAIIKAATGFTYDYIRTARAKGLTERQVVVRHALRGGLLPVVSFTGPALAILITGTVVVERIFALPGLGTYFINANLNRDEPLILGIVAFVSVLVLAFNLIVDIAYGFIDPRIRY